jgi:nicotinamide-nucleotide amidase
VSSGLEPPREPGPVTAEDLAALADQLKDPVVVQEVVDDAALECVRLLHRAGRTLATAESLTGGWVGSAVTSVPGASRVYRGGVVAYATDLKHQLLGVDAALLARVGAVDAEVAGTMAEGVRDRLGADYGLSTTGVAGPDPQDGHPPGTVWVGIATPGGPTWEINASVVDPAADRTAVRRLTVMMALVHFGRVLRNAGEDAGAARG